VNDEYRDGSDGPSSNRIEELAARARAVAARAEEVSRQAAAAAESESELAVLERELADLDEEERKLDAEFSALLDDEPTATRDERAHDPSPAGAGPTRQERLTNWADRFAEQMDNLGDRLSDIISSTFSSGGSAFGIGNVRQADTVERTASVTGPVPVTIQNSAGKVVVRRGGDDVVRVVAERRGAAVADATIDVVAKDGGVTVTCELPRTSGFVPGWVNLDIAVPRGSAVVTTTAGGPVYVDDVGAPVKATTKGGAIRVRGAAGLADVETLGGSIVVAEHDGPVRAKTLGGSVKLSGHLTGEVSADTAGGSIAISGVDGTVRAQTSGGSVRAAGRFRGDSLLATSGGPVSAKVAAGSNLRVEGRGNSAASDFSEVHVSRGRIDGTLGDGSDGTLTLRTTAGNVRVGPE
jgi:hypothetical protein